MSRHEVEDQARDFAGLFVEREMACIQEMDLGVGQIASERFRTWRNE